MRWTPLPQRLGNAVRNFRIGLHGERALWDGGAMNRLVLDWIAQCRPADDEIRGDIRMLRARARELGRNNSYVKRYFRLLHNNVIGPGGIKLQAMVANSAGDPDDKVNAAIEAAWNAWATGRVTVDGQLTLRRFMKIVLKTVACDGEAFVRIYRGFNGNPFGIAVQPIDADLIDEQYNVSPRAGQNEIRMGIEVDSLSRPVGYWVWKQSTTWATTITRERYFVPADEMLHLYDPERVNQTRGVTWVHAVMVPAHMLNAYEESEAVASRVASAKMGFLQKKEGSIGADLSKGKNPAFLEANPGSLEIVAEGYEFSAWDPTHPTSQFPSFVKQMLRKIATGFGVFYNSLANDAEGVSYSSMRSFALIEHDDWRGIQQDLIEMFCRPLYEAFLKMALLVPGAPLKLPTRNPAQYMAVRFRPRGWAWIDPQKEAAGAVLSIENGIGTRTGFLAEKGEDIEDVFRDLAHEQKLAEKYGISIGGGLPPEPTMTAEQWAQQKKDDEDDGKKNGDGRDDEDEDRGVKFLRPRQRPANQQVT